MYSLERENVLFHKPKNEHHLNALGFHMILIVQTYESLYSQLIYHFKLQKCSPLRNFDWLGTFL